MQKLTESDVLRLHNWARMGCSQETIASRLGVHRNTVSAHLLGRVSYPPELVLRVGLKAPPAPSPDQLVSIYSAAALLPDQPSPTKLHRLIRDKALRVRRRKGRIFTRLDWIQECALRMFPAGLWFNSESLYTYAHGTLALLKALEPVRYSSTFYPSKKVGYYPAPRVYAVAQALELPISVPAYRVKIALAGLEAVGVHVI